MRGRGLKPARNEMWAKHDHVAPHAGAWIETFLLGLTPLKVLSPPMRGRGLKPH